MGAEALTYANIVQDAVQTAQFTSEELARLSVVKNNLGANAAHDGEEFRLELADLFDESSFEKNIIKYLQEYRLQAQATDIEQSFSHGHIRDAKGVPMVETGKRSIKDKVLRNRHGDLSKVAADLLCMAELDNLCNRARDGETIIYASTPDAEYGYTYGFLYVGHVRELTQWDKKITLTSIRLDSAKFDDYNKILSDLTRENIAFSTPNEALVNPKLVSETLTNPQIFNTLKKYCRFEYNPNEKKRNDDILHQMSSRITDYVRFVKSGVSLEDRVAGFQTLEKYALKLKENYGKIENSQVLWQKDTYISGNRDTDFRGFISQHKTQTLPQVAGTCSGKIKNSANMYGVDSIFNDYSIQDEADAILEALGFGEEEDEHGPLRFKCKDKPQGCGQWNDRPKHKLIKNCKHCGVDLTCGAKVDIHKSDPTKITAFQNKENNPVKRDVFNREVVQQKQQPANKNTFSITLFQGSSSRLISTEQEEGKRN